MMKQQLWMLNSSLLLICIITLSISLIIQQTSPPFRKRVTLLEEFEKQTVLPTASIESIYKNDLFGTFIYKEFRPTPKSLVTQIPQPPTVSIIQPPELAKPDFISPLAITLKGIAFSLDEEKSISMISDETKKEQIYHLGDNIKDGQLIKIAKNRITLIRANGQHETIFLRKDDNKATQSKEKQWDHIVKKIENNTYQVDIVKFPKEIDSLGSFIKNLSLLTLYKKGSPVGLKAINITPNSIGMALGLQKNDIITQIQNIKTADKKGRIQIYDKLTQIKKGDAVILTLKRNEQLVTLNYQLTEIAKSEKKEFLPQNEKKSTEKKDDEKDKLFKMNKLQEREQRLREFTQHHNGKQQNAIEEIRQRLLDNMKSRARNARIR